MKNAVKLWTELSVDWIKRPTLSNVEGSEVKSLSCVQLFATPWTVAYQASLFMGSSRQAYWSGLPFPSPGDLPDPGIEPDLPRCRQTVYQLSHQGSLYQCVCVGGLSFNKLEAQWNKKVKRRVASLSSWAGMSSFSCLWASVLLVPGTLNL